MKTITFILLVALGTLVLQANVSAATLATYNGSYCGPYFGNQASDLVRGFNGISNYANAFRYISCPVIEQSVGNTQGVLPTLLKFTGVGTITCAFYSNNADGSMRHTQIVSRTDTGWLTIPSINQDDSFGSYSMYCSLPPRSTLNTIFFEEHDAKS
ncbi:MAG: hypothetical protein ACU4EQ_09275 [Candidatus Nitrosoglobus sp.]|jgi:hypothetical protein